MNRLDSSGNSAPADSSDTEMTLHARQALVASIARNEGLDARTTSAMMAVPRHLFVPQALQAYAYDDGPLPIGSGQTISQPTVVAMMTQALRLKGDERVLEVGTGSGYQAAVLSRLCREVDTIELLPELAERARRVLQKAGFSNVRVYVGDGYAGLPERAPFDAIIVTAAPPSIPLTLLAQLREGGRMVLPVGPDRGVQELVLLVKYEGSVRESGLGAVRFVPMVHGDAGERNR